MSTEEAVRKIKESVPRALSFRDQCAIAAIQSVAMSFIESAKPGEIMSAKTLSSEAFAIADAMEAERVKRS